MKKLLKLAGIITILLSALNLSAATYYLHQAGNCSTNWGDALGVWSNGTSISCEVDLRYSVTDAAQEFKNEYLETYCTGNNWCYILNYSAGDAVVGYALATATKQYNIIYIATSAGAGGGSELANFGALSRYFTCDLAGDLQPSSVRNLYNHNDTNGAAIYRIGGYDGWWYSAWMLPGEDDGVIAMHSSAGCTSTGRYNNMCSCSRWNNNYVAYTCDGYNKDHYEIKTHFVNLLGGY